MIKLIRSIKLDKTKITALVVILSNGILRLNEYFTVVELPIDIPTWVISMVSILSFIIVTVGILDNTDEVK